MPDENPSPDYRPLISERAAEPRPLTPLTPGQRHLIVVIIVLAVASFVVHVLAKVGLRHSSALFIGVPALIAIGIAQSPKPKTGTGTMLRVITLALLLSSIVFAEGMICIVLAAPLFYLVGFIVIKAIAVLRGGPPRGRNSYVIVALLLVLPTGFEGTIPGVEFNREETVTVSRVVLGTPDQVSTALAGRPGFAAQLPAFLRIGFPRPVATRGSGLALGDERAIVFAHAHGGHVERGTLTFRVAERDSGFVRFAPVGDDSYVTHWLTWRASEVRWSAASPTTTRVEWTLRYRRRLDPAWYFKPLERYGVGVAAGYLIDALATPGASPSTAPVAAPTTEGFRHEGHPHG